MGKGPVNSRWTRGVVRYEDYLLNPQLGDDGIQVANLTGMGIRIAERFIRSTPPKKIKGNDSTRWREIRIQTVVEVQVVSKPCIMMIVGSSPGYSRTNIRCSFRCTKVSW
jgi:hypothetical protein